MKKHFLELCLLSSVLLLGLLTQIQTVKAALETYTWHPPPGDHEAFEIYVEAEDSWQTGFSMPVLVKVTLTAKHWSFDHVDIKWTKVEISTLKFAMDSGNMAETASFKNVGEHYERRISFEVPLGRLNRGENTSLSIIWSINVDIVDNVQLKHWVYTGSNSDNPLTVSLYRPFLSALEVLIIGAIVVVVIAGTTGFALYRRRKTSSKPSLTSTK